MKVSNKQIIEIFENNEDCKTKTQIAAELGITIQSLNKRLKKLSVNVRDHVKEYARKRALLTMNELGAQSKAGKTEATKELLRLADAGNASLLDVGDGSWRISIEKIEKEPEKAE